MSFDLESLLLMAVVAMTGLLALVVCLKNPWWAVAATILSLPLVPFWVGDSIGGFFISAHILLAAFSLLSMLRVREVPVRASVADWLVGALLLISAVALLSNSTTIAQFWTLTQWLILYTFARVAAVTYGIPRIARWFVAGCGIAAAMILIESLVDFNPWVRYVRVDNGLYAQWSNIQSRGGVARAEGAFGHSIAAGCSLAVAAVLALSTRWRVPVRLAIAALLTFATVVTISRVGMITAVLGIALAALLGRGLDLTRNIRAVVLGVVGAGSIVALLGLADIFAESGDEAANSAAYRVWLIDLVPTIQPIGLASSFNRTTAGGTSFGAFNSIDNALLLFALTQGWLATAIVVALLAGAVLRVGGLRASPPTITVVALIPALATVALITQFALVLWLVAGLAVTETVAQRPDPGDAEPPVERHPAPTLVSSTLAPDLSDSLPKGN